MGNPLAKLTPLTIIATFVTLVETVNGVVVTHTQGGIQVALVVFVVAFPVLVLTVFSLVLWYKPKNFYAPSDYEGMSSEQMGQFNEQLSQGQPRLSIVVTEPADESVNHKIRFESMDVWLDFPSRQLLILMHEQAVTLSLASPYFYDAGTRDGVWSGGNLSPAATVASLRGGEFLDLDDTMSVRLSERGTAFASWLVENGRKADYLQSNYGGWGKPLAGPPDGWREQKAHLYRPSSEPTSGK